MKKILNEGGGGTSGNGGTGGTDSGAISIGDIQQPVEPDAFVSSTNSAVEKLKKKGWKPVVLNPKTGKYEVQG